MPGWRYDGSQWVELVRFRRFVAGSWSRLSGWRWDGANWIPLFTQASAGVVLTPLAFNLDETTVPQPGTFNLTRDIQL